MLIRLLTKQARDYHLWWIPITIVALRDARIAIDAAFISIGLLCELLSLALLWFQHDPLQCPQPLIFLLIPFYKLLNDFKSCRIIVLRLRLAFRIFGFCGTLRRMYLRYGFRKGGVHRRKTMTQSIISSREIGKQPDKHALFESAVFV